MMMSAPVPDWIADVMRDCRSLAFTVSILRVMPSCFFASCTILPLSRASEAGTKSVHRSQWTFFSWARAGPEPLASMAAMPPAPFKSLRRAMRVMVALPRNFVGSEKETRRDVCWELRQATRFHAGTRTTLSRYELRLRPLTLDGAGRESGHVVLDEEGVDDGNRDRAEQGRRHQLAPVEDVAAHQLGDRPDRHGANLGLGEEDQRVQELVLRQGEGEDAGRDEARPAQGQDDLDQRLQPARAVDSRRILELARHGAEVAEQQPGAERDQQGGIGQDHR